MPEAHADSQRNSLFVGFDLVKECFFDAFLPFNVFRALCVSVVN